MRAPRPALKGHRELSMDDVDAAAIARALGNPLRIGFLRLLRDRRMLSPVEYSRESGQELREVSRQVRALVAGELIAVVEVVPRRGASEHRYAPSGTRGEAALAIVELLGSL
jgi:DNA-binding transcriptional ArsR family regulator